MELEFRLITKLIALANNSDNQVVHKMACIGTDKRGRVISWGINSKKTHPYQSEMANATGNIHKIYLHAEIACLVRSRKKIETLYICRLSNNGKLNMAKPCDICMEAIKIAKVSKVIYSTKYGTFEELFI